MRRNYSLYWRDETGSWWVNFHVKLPGGKAKRTRLNTHVATRGKGGRPTEEAERAAHMKWLEGSKDAPPTPETAALSITTLAAMFLEQDVADRAREFCPTYAQHEDCQMAIILRYIPTMEALRSLDEDAWGAITRSMRLEAKIGQPGRKGGRPMTRKGYSLASIRHVTTTLRAFLRFCRKKGAIAVVPLLSMPENTAVAADAAPRRDMTEDERDRLLTWLRDNGHDKALRFYVLAFYSAMRRSEISRMTPRWLDFDRGYIRFPGDQTKTGREVSDQRIAIHPKAEAAIREQMVANGAINRDAPIFGEVNFEYVFWKAIEALGIDRYGLTAHHVTRHTCCTMVGAKATTLQEVQSVTRHRDLGMVRRYWHEDSKASKVALSRLA